MHIDVPVIGIIRGLDTAYFRSLMNISFSAGLRAIEITMNTENALRTVSTLRSSVPEGRWLGMGTVRNIDEAKQAVEAGAMFIVTPNTDTKVIEYARSHSIPVVAGALTPTEVYTAWSAGADMIKVFPCGPFGPGYIRDLLGPYDHIRLVPVGGVTTDNVREYFDAGAAAVGVSTALFGRRALKENSLDELERHVSGFLPLCPERMK